ncbi:MAG TPA: EF-P beta-lysylation protein EpmB [Gammaproteobacteria bacterium]
MQQPDWKTAQAAAVTDPARLIEALGLDPALLPAARAAAGRFPLRVPIGFINRMRRGDPHDPLLRQVLPLDAELETHAGYSQDPVGESSMHIAPGLLQKYAGRVLLTTTGACGVHCRYCFRRHFPYSEQNPRRDWNAVIARIAADDSIHEVILSGGDPFTLDTPRLREISSALDAISHVRRLRIHTRQPVVLPERVDDRLLDWLGNVSSDVAIVIHANHANEIDASVRDAMNGLKRSGATLLNQSVLLRGVNDSASALADLGEALFSAGVLPYYLHLLDPVAGAAHFDVPEGRAREIMRELHARVSGYLVPKLVREIPGGLGKTLINL